MVGLALQTDFDGVERVLDVFADNASGLYMSAEVTPFHHGLNTYRAVDNILNGLQGSCLALGRDGWWLVRLNRDGGRFHRLAEAALRALYVQRGISGKQVASSPADLRPPVQVRA